MPAAPSIFTCHGSAREALWLFTWLLSFTKQVPFEWQPVADGVPIPDSQVAFNLDVTVATVARWRRRLEALGVVRSEIVRPRWRQYWIAGPQQQVDRAVEAPAVVN